MFGYTSLLGSKWSEVSRIDGQDEAVRSFDSSAQEAEARVDIPLEALWLCFDLSDPAQQRVRRY
jgi:hypothetical protein